MSDALVHGGFSCVQEHAVEIAHMVSNAEAALQSSRGLGFEVWDVLRDYLEGTISASEAIEQFEEGWPEAFPGLDAERSK